MTPKESVFAEKAFAHMESYAVLPIPENYAVWYHYAAGSNEDLVREIEHAIAHKVPFSNETCGYLYNKFILSPANPQQKSVDDATDNAQKILADMIKIAGGITGETKNYNKNLDVYMHQIGKHIEHSDVRAIFKDLVASTASFKENSEASAKKLEESTKEIETLRKNLEQVTAASQRDFLTGVYNRKTFEQFFDEQLTVSREQKNDLCLLMLDIDHFKKFNDTYGHLLGDEVLKIVAHSLTNTLKGRDIVARFGGEEFIIMLPETSLDIAVKVADMIRGNIVSKEIKKRNTGETYGTITVSIGVARLRAETDTLPSLIKRADEALYRSKRDGRNRVTREA
jgi:diguanylate cyclase